MQTKAPLSTHRLFPVIVALWCAALFGLGSLVLPQGIFERIVTSTGISSLIPAAQPPLGFTARMLIALFATGVGVAVGLFLARQITRLRGETRLAETPSPRLRRALTESARRPLYIKEELGDEAAIEPPAPVPASAATEPPQVFIRQFQETEAEAQPVFAASDEAADSAHDPDEAAPISVFPSEPVTPSPFPSTFTPVSPRHIEQAPAPETAAPFQHAVPVEQPEPETARVPRATPRGPDFTRLPANLPLDELGFVQLTERLAHSLRNRAERGRDTRPATIPPALAAMLGLPEKPPAPTRPVPVPTAQPPLAATPGQSDVASPRPSNPVLTEAEVTPAALHPLGFELDDFGEDEVDFEFEDFGDEDAYSSLLDIKGAQHSATEAAVERPFDTPADDAAPQPGTDREETERALRSALGRLQGLSGAA